VRGEKGFSALSLVMAEIRRIAPKIPVILNGRFGDTSQANGAYAQLAFDHLGVDAVTVNPGLGAESLKPFLDKPTKGVFVVCRTMDPGSDEYQKAPIQVAPVKGGYEYLYERLATSVAGKKWNAHGNCGLVVEAATPEELARTRELAPQVPILIFGGRPNLNYFLAAGKHRLLVDCSPVFGERDRVLTIHRSGVQVLKGASQTLPSHAAKGSKLN
jgi:orotidine-5'-phosphate decarboxylase